MYLEHCYCTRDPNLNLTNYEVQGERLDLSGFQVPHQQGYALEPDVPHNTSNFNIEFS